MLTRSNGRAINGEDAAIGWPREAGAGRRDETQGFHVRRSKADRPLTARSRRSGDGECPLPPSTELWLRVQFRPVANSPLREGWRQQAGCADLVHPRKWRPTVRSGATRRRPCASVSDILEFLWCSRKASQAAYSRCPSLGRSNLRSCAVAHVSCFLTDARFGAHQEDHR